MGCERAHVIARANEGVDSRKAGAAQARFARRLAGEPLAYITGSREFYGIALRVTPDVLVPRPETELLVDLALERLPPGSTARVLELGTGSGAVAIALATLRPELGIVATDVSEATLALATSNACGQGVEIEFIQSDWFEAIG